jgi:hypothetical protein
VPVHVAIKRIRLSALLLVMLVTVAAYSKGAVETPTVEDFGERRGREGIYARIEGLIDCTALQGEFDAAQTNLDRDLDTRLTAIPESYAQVAMDRMEELNCGEDSPTGEQS